LGVDDFGDKSQVRSLQQRSNSNEIISSFSNVLFTANLLESSIATLAIVAG
jgi:hypothetical protein